MTYRLLAFACGLLAGLILHAALAPFPEAAKTLPAAAPMPADARCPAHPLKMPCLFDTRP